MYALNLNLFFENNELTNNVFKVIEPELNQKIEHRSKTMIRVKNNCFTIKINSKDKTALKASINSYLKAIILCNKLNKV